MNRYNRTWDDQSSSLSFGARGELPETPKPGDTAFARRLQAELGADIVSREEMTLQPGEKRPYSKTLAADTRFIAVFAAYRDLEHARWRAVVPVQVGQKQKLTIQADELSVSATVEKP